MTTTVLEAKTESTAAYDVADVEYLRHGDKPLLARIYKPRGAACVLFAAGHGDGSADLSELGPTRLDH